MKSFESRSDRAEAEEDREVLDAASVEVLTDEERRARRPKKEKWQTAAGVYVSVKSPDWGARNSRRL